MQPSNPLFPSFLQLPPPKQPPTDPLTTPPLNIVFPHPQLPLPPSPPFPTHAFTMPPSSPLPQPSSPPSPQSPLSQNPPSPPLSPSTMLCPQLSPSPPFAPLSQDPPSCPLKSPPSPSTMPHSVPFSSPSPQTTYHKRKKLTTTTSSRQRRPLTRSKASTTISATKTNCKNSALGSKTKPIPCSPPSSSSSSYESSTTPLTVPQTFLLLSLVLSAFNMPLSDPKLPPPPLLPSPPCLFQSGLAVFFFPLGFPSQLLIPWPNFFSFRVGTRYLPCIRECMTTLCLNFIQTPPFRP